jgi:hypothetical protein
MRTSTGWFPYPGKGLKRMKHKPIRITIGLLAAFIALTAGGGGIAILTGIDPFPPEWLEGTPFHTYTIPALLLSVAVGGSSLLAAVMVFAGRARDLIAATAAGLIMAGYIVVEVLILNDGPGGPTPIEYFYLGLGLALAALAGYLWMVEDRPQRGQMA